MIQVCKAILLNKNREVLLLLRDNNKQISYPDYWDLIGGGLEEGESKIQCTLREIKEEIGFKPNDLKELGAIFIKKSNLNIEDVTMTIFFGVINIPLSKLRLTEGQKLGYFKIENLSKIKIPEHSKQFIEKNLPKIFDFLNSS